MGDFQVMQAMLSEQIFVMSTSTMAMWRLYFEGVRHIYSRGHSY